MGLNTRKPAFGVCEQQSADQPAYPHRLIFVIHLMECIIFQLVFVAKQDGLGMTWSETPKTGFLALRPIYEWAFTWDNNLHHSLAITAQIYKAFEIPSFWWNNILYRYYHLRQFEQKKGANVLYVMLAFLWTDVKIRVFIYFKHSQQKHVGTQKNHWENSIENSKRYKCLDLWIIK